MNSHGEFSIKIIGSNQCNGYVERSLSVIDKVEYFNESQLIIKIIHIYSLHAVGQNSSGDTVSDTELEFSWQVFQSTDHHYCGGGDVQGAA